MAEEIKKTSEKKGKVEDLRLTPADNGFKVCWSECGKNVDGGQYGNRNYEYHEEVFKEDEESQAIGRFKDLKNQMKKGDPISEDNY